MTPAVRDKLIVALDVPEYDPARELVEHLGDEVSFYKIGLELVFSGGLDLAQELKNEGKRVFLDMKLLDIGNTVERAVATAAGAGRRFPDHSRTRPKDLGCRRQRPWHFPAQAPGRHGADQPGCQRSRRAGHIHGAGRSCAAPGPHGARGRL